MSNEIDYKMIANCMRLSLHCKKGVVEYIKKARDLGFSPSLRFVAVAMDGSTPHGMLLDGIDCEGLGDLIYISASTSSMASVELVEDKNFVGFVDTIDGKMIKLPLCTLIGVDVFESDYKMNEEMGTIIKCAEEGKIHNPQVISYIEYDRYKIWDGAFDFDQMTDDEVQDYLSKVKGGTYQSDDEEVTLELSTTSSQPEVVYQDPDLESKVTESNFFGSVSSQKVLN